MVDAAQVKMWGRPVGVVRFLTDKARRHYLRIVNERIARFTRTSD